MPGASTTVISPAGAGIESSIVTARLAATSATSRGGFASTNSTPAHAAGPWKPVWIVSSRFATTWETRRMRGRASSTQRPSLDAIRRRCKESPYTPTTWTTSGLKPRAASSTSRSHATLSAAGTCAGGSLRMVRLGPLQRAQVDDRARSVVTEGGARGVRRLEQGVAIESVRERVAVAWCPA